MLSSFVFPVLFIHYAFLLPVRLGASEIQAALDRMIDRCQSGAQGSVRATAEELVSLLGLTDRESAVKVCGLYSKVSAVRERAAWLGAGFMEGQSRKGKYIVFLCAACIKL